MNLQPINWFASLAIIVIWAGLLWWTFRMTTTSRLGLTLKTLVLCVLIAVGGIMLWNTYVIYGRLH